MHRLFQSQLVVRRLLRMSSQYLFSPRGHFVLRFVFLIFSFATREIILHTAFVSCPPGYTTTAAVPGSCYLYSSSPVTWFTANDVCLSATNSYGWLVTINTAAENAHVNSYSSVWLGTAKLSYTYAWYWRWGTSAYTNWAYGRPNYCYSFASCCGQMLRGWGGTWVDYDCGNSLPYVCENCMAGYVVSAGASSSCSPCPAGSYSGPAARTCISAPAGKPASSLFTSHIISYRVANVDIILITFSSPYVFPPQDLTFRSPDHQCTMRVLPGPIPWPGHRPAPIVLSVLGPSPPPPRARRC